MSETTGDPSVLAPPDAPAPGLRSSEIAGVAASETAGDDLLPSCSVPVENVVHGYASCALPLAITVSFPDGILETVENTCSNTVYPREFRPRTVKRA